jgi:hypothetical protein
VVGTIWFNKFIIQSYALVFMDFTCWLSLLHKIFSSFSILVSDLCMFYYDFNCILFCYLRSTKAGLRYLCSCNCTDMVCRVTEISSFCGIQQSRCLPTHLKTETNPVSETLYSLVFRIPDWTKPKSPVIPKYGVLLTVFIFTCNFPASLFVYYMLVYFYILDLDMCVG